MFDSRRRNFSLLFFVVLLVVMTYWLRNRNALINFTDADGPKYVGSYAPVPPDLPEQIKVVSWNIKFAVKIDQAIEELQTVAALQGADVILLQEMDNEGVERIARALGYNYVYYPASIHSRTGRAFGNAVLSRWPLQSSHKLLLPHASPMNRQRRIAVGAVLAIGEQEVTAYSVHTETPVLSGAKRNEQVAHFREQVANALPACMIVGGDFNTFSARSAQMLEETMAATGLTSVFEERPTTVKTPLVNFSVDHLFVRGFAPIAAGTWSGTSASDHYPIWANLEPCSEETAWD